MKKSILNLGKALNKAEQKSINGGGKRLGECLVPDPDNNFEPMLVGYAACNTYTCPPQPTYQYFQYYQPVCFGM